MDMKKIAFVVLVAAVCMSAVMAAVPKPKAGANPLTATVGAAAPAPDASAPAPAPSSANTVVGSLAGAVFVSFLALYVHWFLDKTTSQAHKPADHSKVVHHEQDEPGSTSVAIRVGTNHKGRRREKHVSLFSLSLSSRRSKICYARGKALLSDAILSLGDRFRRFNFKQSLFTVCELIRWTTKRLDVKLLLKAKLAASSIGSIVNGTSSSHGKEPVAANPADPKTIFMNSAVTFRSEYDSPSPFSFGPSESAVAKPDPESFTFGSGQNGEPKPEGPKRCTTCNKRVGLTGFNCRCGDLFCAVHRYSDKHDCPYDYRTAGRDAIAKANPVVKAEKLDKI
ncbi:hypothetical protein ACLB2K_030783 [Fragaria x ananassa]